MNLVMIIGSGAVGKMTVGRELMKITNYRLFHNHMMIEPVIDIFGKFDGSVVAKLRDDIFEAFLNTCFDGMIFTFMWAFDMQSDWDYVNHIAKRFEATGGTVYYVELVADRSVRIERNKTENRLASKASKRDIALSEGRMLREETKYRLVSKEGEIPFPNYIRIDNTDLEPDTVARMIKERFALPDKDRREITLNIKLEEARDDELEELLELQKESFMPLYEKYRDEGSPALDTIDRVRSRVREDRKYYFIVYYGMRVGGINIGSKPGCDSDPNVKYISPLFVIPHFQNRGIGYEAICKAFEMFPDAAAWKLSTILEEPRDLHLYEKCGFVRVGNEEKINDRMTLVSYEKKQNVENI